MRPNFDGVLFFPVTPFTESGAVDLEALAAHLTKGLEAGPGGIFIACGTGEFHAIDEDEFRDIVTTAVKVVAGRVPVYAGAGGSVAQAKRFAVTAQEAGADGLLLLPPYLVEVPQPGLVDFVAAVAGATELPVIVYNRNNAKFTEASAVAVAKISNVIGFKDGTGNFDQVARIVAAVKSEVDPDFLFFNGLPTAETTQLAFRAIGVPLYSSATFAFAPDLALAFYNSLESGNTELTNALLNAFFIPLVQLRDTVPGYAVSLVKAGVTMEGVPAGPVRPPLVMPHADDLAQLNSIIAAGRAVLAASLSEAR
ncbi:5-dehydro-4-deoxyglucarate dehydratase [Mycolicibacterium frederiksbergense]|uniref:Probable 5-dehydro-4-deoxyglucarate dehydratase n=1 Tax=Mycolicibacterium frederiksbergense TaxID=117567 RepID=A0A6H0S604_9MYCO|nr:5-dehydro-4-deoxyglucarate dehydratase [Mycolicibacterium frederiksbergense]MBX9919407.1 5-dehydro-4-deoxyglucarate dehydratase [Mycolicibacterium frederiksbergense]MDO0974487.1 5-dehydro-4-deoxyglucarate dehydratase [Mycolicibacterium frederiksbergense]QIV82596.1 5-dehydro-4-deoxyglucarate dehydratase [Mycolicibacterium frederiksbergense]